LLYYVDSSRFITEKQLPAMAALMSLSAMFMIAIGTAIGSSKIVDHVPDLVCK
jgi:hypothetical protein